MKAIAIFLIILCLAAFGGLGYLYLSTNVTVEGTGCIATEAASQQEYFEQLREAFENGTFTGTRFTEEAPGDVAGYQFYTYTARLKNSTFLNAEVVELQIAPMSGDVLQVGDAEQHTLKARSTGDISATILTSKAMHNVREMTVSYHLWGLPFTVKVTYSH